MHVVVVNGNDALDGRWKSVGKGLVANGSFCKSGVAVQVLVKDKAVNVEIRQDPIRAGWRVYTSAQKDWSAERVVVGGWVGSDVVGDVVVRGGVRCGGLSVCGCASSASSVKRNKTSDCSS